MCKCLGKGIRDRTRVEKECDSVVCGWQIPFVGDEIEGDAVVDAR